MRAPIALLAPRSPSQWPGMARPAASAERSLARDRAALLELQHPPYQVTYYPATKRSTVRREFPLHRHRPIHQPSSVLRNDQTVEDNIPSAIAREPAMPGPHPHPLPRTEHLGQVPPRDPGPIPGDDALDHAARIRERAPLPTGPSRKQIGDQHRLRIRKQLKTEAPTIIPHAPNSNYKTRSRACC